MQQVFISNAQKPKTHQLRILVYLHDDDDDDIVRHKYIRDSHNQCSTFKELNNNDSRAIIPAQTERWLAEGG